MIKITLLATIGIAGITLTACGQKGNLYLPNETSSIQQIRSQQSNKGHEQDKFIIPQNSSQTPQTDKQIQQRIEEMQSNPNDF